MRIESFWARGYRSLRDVRLEGLGAFNTFYGANGSGKSNILEAIRVLLNICRLETHLHSSGNGCDQLGTAVVRQGVVRERDLYARDESRTIVLGARFTGAEPGSPITAGSLALEDLTVEYTVEWIVHRAPYIFTSRLQSGGEDLDTRAERQHLLALLTETLPSQAYTLIGAHRVPRVETNIEPPAGEQDILAWHLRNGRLKNALVAAHINPQPAIRRRLGELRALLSGPPLHRPPFDPVGDLTTGMVDLHERLAEPNPKGLDVPLDLAGLGVAQIYAILAQAMLSGARAVAIEEPEAHLHAPTTGRHLRELLKRLVDEHHIDQLFIATHSNLFDLDSTGYFDVSLKNGETVVERADLTRIDRDHLYEPGPAKHALQRMLEYMPPTEVVFRHADGSPIAATEMLQLLQEGDDVAVRFLEDLHGAALRMVKVGAKKKAG